MISIKTESVAYTADVNYVYDLNELDINKDGNSVRISLSNDKVRIEIGGTHSRVVEVTFDEFYNHLANV